jgi:uncharacterized membrane protein YadS
MSKDMGYVNNFGFISDFTFPSLYNILSFTSNVFAVFNGFKVVKYLSHVHGNPPKVGWLLNNLSKCGKMSDYLGYAAAAVDGVNVYFNTSDLGLAW